MQEIRERCFSAPNLSPNNLDIFVRERIHIPIVDELYTEFVNNGTNQVLVKILNQIPPEYHPPILHTLATHVTKEKPVFIYSIGHDVDANRARFVAASTDLLWCLSLMVDDIIDNDDFRANRRTAWRIYGQQETYRSAEVAFRTLQHLTTQILSPEAEQLLVETVEDGLRSLRDPVVKNMDSGVDDILSNIDRRARFHCEYPVKALFTNTGNEELIQAATNALFCVNRAGQILNDVKDLVLSEIYGRLPYTDIHSGTVTVPLIMLQKVSTTDEKQKLRECFNSPSLTSEQMNWLQGFIVRKLPKQQIHNLISENYRIFLETMSQIVASEYFVLCQGWVDYKIGQANKLLLN